MPAEDDVFLAHPKRLPGSNQQLFPDQVKAGDHFRDGVFHLETGVHLDEGNLVVDGVVQELDRSQTLVMALPGELHRGFQHVPADVVRQVRRGRFLEDFLLPALHGAVPVPEMDDVGAVAENLDLNVPGAFHELLQVDGGAAKRGGRFGLGYFDGRGQVFGTRHEPDSAPAAARGRLDHQGVTDLGRDFQQGIAGGGLAVCSAQRGNARRLRSLPGPRLVAHQFDGFRGRAHPDEPRLHDGPGKSGVFGQEPVAGVHRVATEVGCRFEDGAVVQVALAGGGRPNDRVFIRQAGGQPVGVRFAGHHHRVDPQFAGGADDPYCDLPAVGYEESLHGFSSITAITSPGLTVPESDTSNLTRFPATSVLTSLNCFMISTTPIVWPASTSSPSCTYGSLSGPGLR